MPLKATTAYLGLGSNLCAPRQQILLALQKISLLPQLQLLQNSRLVRSAPQGRVARQPDFVNAVCQITTTLTAHALLQEILALEKQLGRVRLLQGGPRIIDLDLLLYGEAIINDEHLTVPHPRMHERRFVLQPLLEIAPAIVISGLGPAVEYMRTCQDQRLEWLQPEPVRQVI